MKALGKSPGGRCALQALGILALALGLGLAAALASIRATEGEYVPPLDDTFIYLQYARGAAEGTPFVYQPGAPPTRGATSLLYPWLLAPWTRILSGEHAAWAAWALGVLCLAGAAFAALRLAGRLWGPWAGAAAAALTLASGHFLWGTASGMDVGVYALGAVAAPAALAWYLDAPDPRAGLRRMAGLAAGLTFLSLARPEGVLLAAVVAGAAVVPSTVPNSRRARWSLLLIPAAVGVMSTGINVLATGVAATNSLEAKAIWSEIRPDVRARIFERLPEILGRITWAAFTDFRSASFGHGTQWALRALFLAGGILGLARALRPRARAAERALVAVLAAGLLAGLVPVGYSAHNFRYQIPLVPLVAILVAGGLSWLPRPRLGGAAAGLLVVLLLPGTVRMIARYGENADNIHDHQVAAGRWIDANLPAGAIVGINDAGAIAYYGNRRVVDLVGLVTNGSALPHRAGPASLYEWLESLPTENRPTHFAIFPDWFPYLSRTSLIGEKLISFHLPKNTISGADLKGIYRADWGNAGRGDRPVLRAPLLDAWGFAVVDSLDVADLASMRMHAYEAFPTWRQALREFPVLGRPEAVLIDGGIEPRGGERFRLRCRPGEPAALVMRTEAYLPFTLEVTIDGAPAGTWTIERNSQAWTEPLFEIPGDLLNGPAAVIGLELPENAPPYSSYYYWLLQ